jgi:DNA-binding response OmpR family regulator
MVLPLIRQRQRGYGMARILIVEDDGALRQDLADRLEDWGYEVRQAADGLQGFAVIETWHPDLILSDVNMPQCSGITLAEHLASPGSPWAGVSIFFISAASKRSQILEGIASGADDYLVKPIDYELLKTKIKVHLKKKQAFLAEDRLDQFAVRISNSMLSGSVFAGAAGVALIIAFFFAYWFKVALGINVFEDLHFSDIFL